MIEEEFKEYNNCTLCPRNCKVDRRQKTGFCKENDKLSIDNYLLHFGEEPSISFKNGSGTIFFTGCSLRCSFCQNIQISQEPKNKKYYSLNDFIDITIELIEKGADNINFVTPDHFLPHIIKCTAYLKKKGYTLPFIYNCSGYQSIENLKMAIDYIDIFLFDYKFADKEAAKYCIDTPNYPEVCDSALKFIYNNKGNLKLDNNGKALSGVLVRHLVMPHFIKNSLDVINNLFFEYGNTIYLSLMSQYSPSYLRKGHDLINRRLTKNEYEEVTKLIEDLGFTNGYIQSYIDYDDKYLPDFDTKRVFRQEDI